MNAKLQAVYNGIEYIIPMLYELQVELLFILMIPAPLQLCPLLQSPSFLEQSPTADKQDL